MLFALGAEAAGLEVILAPEHLELAIHRKAAVEIRGPADLSLVSVTVNHGRIGELKQLGPGRFLAEYLAPAQTFPRVALIAAVGTSQRAKVHGWARLPLWGQADAILRTAPNAKVSVRISTRTYGPIQADAKGRGRVSVVVPPGVRVGYYGARVLDLGLPRVALSHLVLEEASLDADRAQRLGVRLYAVTEAGEPRTGLALQARAENGEVTAFEPVAPGVYLASWSLPASEPGEAELSVWSATEQGLTASARLRRLAGAPARVALSVEPARFVAGAGSEVKLTARVFDSRGNPAAGSPVFAASLGVAAEAQPAGDGVWVARLLLPDSFRGASSVEVSARLGDAPVARASLALVSGPAAAIQVQPRRLSLLSDPASAAELEVSVLDAWGNPAEGEVSAAAGTGALEPLVGEGAPGRRYRYHPPRSLQDSTTGLELATAALKARVPVELKGAGASFTVAPRAGFLTNLGNATGFTASVELMLWVSEWLGLGADLGYFFAPRDIEVAAGELGGWRSFTRVHGFPLQAAVSWRARLAGRLPFRATASGGVAATTSTFTLRDQQPVREGALAPTARLAVGLGVPLGQGAPFVELGLSWVGDSRGNNLTGALVAVGLSLGYRLDVR